MDKPLHCPFCGSKVEVICASTRYGLRYEISHESRCFLSQYHRQFKTEEDAINSWNLRTEPREVENG